MRIPPHVDHVAIAVRQIEPALELFCDALPGTLASPPEPGYDGEFRWANLLIGNFKIELIDSARPGGFVDRYIERRGEGLHHFTFHVDELDPYLEAFEREGRRIVDRFDMSDDRRTAFVHPKSAWGILLQLWQVPEIHDERIPSAGGRVERHGTHWTVDHLSLAVPDGDEPAAFFREHFEAVEEIAPRPGYDGSFQLRQLLIDDYRLEIIEPLARPSFLTAFLEKRGPGLHHLSIDVGDLDRALEPLEARGVRIVDRSEPAPGWKTAFLHPRSAHGVLIQLWQVPENAEWPSFGA